MGRRQRDPSPAESTEFDQVIKDSHHEAFDDVELERSRDRKPSFE